MEEEWPTLYSRGFTSVFINLCIISAQSLNVRYDLNYLRVKVAEFFDHGSFNSYIIPIETHISAFDVFRLGFEVRLTSLLLIC